MWDHQVDWYWQQVAQSSVHEAGRAAVGIWMMHDITA